MKRRAFSSILFSIIALAILVYLGNRPLRVVAAAFLTEDFEGYAAEDDPVGWLDTGPSNSLTEDNSLFQVFDLDGNKAFGTISNAKHIHSHFIGAGSDTLSGYEYRGRMMTTGAKSGIGVTFLSQYPGSNAYYSLQRNSNNSFSLSAKGTAITGGTIDTGVVPTPDVWYQFRVRVYDTGSLTQIQAKVWQAGATEPGGWQAEAYDDSATRLTAGTVGLWSFANSAKYWDDLEVNTLSAHALTLNVLGNGTVSLNPDKAQYNYGEEVTLSANADPGWEFTGWSGDLSGNNNPETVAMTGDKAITATFTEMSTHTLDVTMIGGGSVTVDPVKPEYSFGEVVTLTAIPDLGWQFAEWSGDLTGSNNPETLTITGNHQVTANFSQVPPVTLTVLPVGSGTVNLDPPGPQYSYGEVVTLTANPDPGWIFTGWGGDLTGSANPETLVMNGDKTVTAGFAAATAIVSDDFDRCALNTGVWSFVNPAGDGGVDVSGGKAWLSVPAGTAHDTWGTSPENFSSTVPRITQPVADGDFELQVKFAATLSQQYQMEGVLVEQDENDMLRLEFLYDGAGLKIYAASFTNGVASNKYYTQIPNGDPLYMRVSRVGDLWTQSYSYDGITWTGMGSFTHAMTVTSVSAYVGNSTVANTVGVDYFYNTAAPGTGDVPQYAVIIDTVGNGSVTRSPDQTAYICGEAVTLTPIADPGWTFETWSGDLTGSDNPETLIMDGNKTVTATFSQLPPVKLTVSTSGNGMVIIDPDKPEYINGEQVLLTAVADPGWGFAGWSGDLSGQENPSTLTMTGDKSVTASFVANADLYVENFENYASNTDPVDWLDTGENNSLTEDDSQFKVFDMGGNKAFGTTTNAKNIHSHYVGTGSEALSGYEFTGRMMMKGARSGIGVTFFSQYPQADGYYSLQRKANNSFHLSPKSTSFTGGTTDTGIVPVQDTWYRFRVRVYDMGSRTEMQAKVWKDNTSEPAGWQVEAYDDSATRLTAGTIGVWSFQSDSAYWDDLAVSLMLPATISVNVVGDGQIALDPDKSIYGDGEQVTLTAWPYPGWVFAGWSGDLSGSNNPETFIANGDKVVTATFVLESSLLLMSDDFDQCTLDTGVWSFVNPLGDGVLDVASGKAWLSVPAGTTHDTYGDNVVPFSSTVPRITQPMEDLDFELEVKFETALSQQYQMVGVLVEQDENDMLRLEFLHTGSGLNILAESYVDGIANNKYFNSIPNGDPLYMRVSRVGDLWTQSYSYDGLNWTAMPSFTHAMTVANIGAYVGNSTVANIVGVDYFYNTAVPGAGDVPQFSVTTNSSGSGVVTKTPDQAAYLCGEVLLLSAIGDPGWTFDSWSGDLAGSNNPEILTVSGDHQVTANFVEGSAYNLSVSTIGNGTVTVDPEKPQYSDGEVVALTAVAGEGSVFTGWSGDLTGSNPTESLTMNSDKSVTATFTDVTAFASDDFDQCSLDTGVWTFVDPAGDGSVDVAGGKAWLSVPAGTTHDTYGTGPLDFSSTVPRIRQPVADEDFELQVKFEADLSQQYQMEGVLVEEDENDMLRLEFFHDGSNLKIYATSFTEGAISDKYIQTIGSGDPLYMRVTRVGDLWTQSYSYDGISWTSMASFTHAMTVTSVSAYVGNSNVANTVGVDYFYNTAAPGTGDVLEKTLLVSLNGGGTVTKSPDLATYQCNDVVTLSAIPDSGWNFDNWSGDLTGGNPTESLTITGDHAVTATFTSNAPLIDVWYGTQQPFGQLGVPQQWINILGNVSDPDGIATLTFSLNGAPDAWLSVGPDDRRLADVGDFNIEINYADPNLIDGLNQVVITAKDIDNNIAQKTVTVSYSSGSVWPLPYSVDWDTVTNIQDVIQIVDGKWALVPGGVRTTQVDYDRMLDLGDLTWSDYEITVPITVHAIDPGGYDPPSTSPGFGLTMRWQGHTDDPVVCMQPHCGWNPSGGGAWYDIGQDGPLNLDGASDPSVTINLDVAYIWKLRVETIPGSGSLYSLKVWEASQPEPIDWNLTKQRGLEDVANGSVILVAHHVDLTFGGVTIVPLVP